MKKKFLKLIACLVLAAVALSACATGSNNTGVPATGITISGTGVNNGALNLSVGGRDIPLSATVRPSDTTETQVTWSSSDEKVVTVSQEGLLHIAGEGKATVTAAVGSVKDSIEVTVTTPMAITGLSFIEASYAVVVPTHNSATLDLAKELMIQPENAQNKTILWSIEPQDENVTVNAQGTVVISANVDMDAAYTVTATAAADATKTASTRITFTREQATGIAVRLSSNGAQKPASYVYEFNLDDNRWQHIFFVAETRPVGSVGNCTFTSSDPSVCDIIEVDSDGRPADTGNNAYLDIKAEGQVTITIQIEGTDIIKEILVKINPAAGYVINDLNVLAGEIPSVVDTANWWDFNLNPTPKPGSLFFSVQEPVNDLGLFFSGIDGTGWCAKQMLNQGNGAYVEDGGFCVVMTGWDWPFDNEQTNGYIFNTVHTPAAATTFRVQLRTQAGTYVSGMAKFRIRMVDKNDLSKQIFLDVHGQTLEGFSVMEGREVKDKATYPSGSFDPGNGWIIIPSVPDYNIGEDIYFCTIPQEWRDRDVVIFIESDDLYESDGMGHMVTGKNDQLLICSMGFVSKANDPTEFMPK